MVRLFKRLLPLALVLGAVVTSPKPAAATTICVSGDCVVTCTVITSEHEFRYYEFQTC